MLAFELPNFFFLICQTISRRFQLIDKKFGSTFRLLLPGFQVFVNKEVSKFAGHLLGGVRIA